MHPKRPGDRLWRLAASPGAQGYRAAGGAGTRGYAPGMDAGVAMEKVGRNERA